MKRFLVAFVLFPLVSSLIGCSDLSNPVETTKSSVVSSNLTNSGLLSITGTPKLVKQPKSTTVRTGLTVSGLVTPAKGGKLTLNSEYQSLAGPVSVKMTLDVPKNAVTSETYVTMTLSEGDLLLDMKFAPAVEFSIPALLNVSASGLDLTGFTDGGVDVWFVDGGVWEYTVQSKKIKVDVSKGTLNADKVQLRHFSRYAFGRVEEASE